MDAFIKNSDGVFRKIPKIFLKNSDGIWRGVVSAFVKNSDGVWRQFFGASYLYPSPTTNPTLTSNNTLDYIFSAGSTLTLTRGVWDKNPTSYSLKIQRSQDNSTWEDIATGTGTSLTYDITYDDALYPSYYYRGFVTATNSYGPGKFYTASTISIIELSVSASASSPTQHGATVSWSVTPSTAAYRASQYIDIYDSYNPSVIVYTENVAYNASSAVISNTAIISNRLHYAIVRVVSNDTSETINSSNTVSFTTTGTLTNTVAPTVTGTKQEGQTVSANPGTWVGTEPITYSYQWQMGFQESGSVYSYTDISGATSSNYFIPYDYNETSSNGGLRLKVTAYDSQNLGGVVAYSQNYAIADFARPVGTDNTVTFSRNSQSSYNYSITSVGTWSGSPTSYRYQWYTREQGAGATYAYFIISGATSSTFDASAYKLSEVFPIVWASNAGGESNTGYPFSSSFTETLGAIDQGTALTVYYKAPVINSFSVTGGTSSATYTYSVSADDPSYSLSISYSGAATGSFTPSSSGSSVTLSTPGTYTFVLTATNSINGNSYSTTSTVANITVTAAITNISLSDTTFFPSSASSISVTNSATANTGSVTWVNNSNTTYANLYSVSGAGSGGAGIDPTTLATSGTFTINSSGTATATIRAINTTKRASVTWTQGSGIQSYRIIYSLSGLGSVTLDGNSSATNPTILLSSDTATRTVTLTSISVYSGLNQTNLVATVLDSSSIIPTNKATNTSGSGSVTYTSVPGLPTITFSSITATGFTVTWSSTGATSYNVDAFRSVSGATVTDSSGNSYPRNGITATSATFTGLNGTLSHSIIVTGVNAGGSTTNSKSIIGTPAVTFGSNTSTSGGFSGSVTNRDSNYSYSFAASSGTVTAGTASGSSYPFTVTGLSAGASSTVTATATRTDYFNGTGSTTGSATSPTPAVTQIQATNGNTTSPYMNYTITCSNAVSCSVSIDRAASSTTTPTTTYTAGTATPLALSSGVGTIGSTTTAAPSGAGAWYRIRVTPYSLASQQGIAGTQVASSWKRNTTTITTTTNPSPTPFGDPNV